MLSTSHLAVNYTIYSINLNKLYHFEIKVMFHTTNEISLCL